MRSSIFDNLFVLEMANNHWGDVERGLKIIADYGKVVRYNNVRAAMKFQFRDVEQFIHKDFRHRTDIRYIKKTLDTQLSWADYQKLVTAVRNASMISMATPFDEVSVDKCVELGIQIIKIASSDIKDWFLIEKIATTKKPVIISTGGSSLRDLDDIVSFFAKRNIPLAINHCVSIYPSEDHELEMNQIDFLKSRYPDNVIGFSTHEYHDWHNSMLIAYAKGARTFERHVDIEAGGIPVSPYCSLPEQVDTWFKAFHKAEEMCGGSAAAKRVPPEKEVRYLDGLVRGVYAKRELPAGHVLSDEDVYLAIPLQKGQISCREMMKGEVLINPIAKDAAIAFTNIDSPYGADSALAKMIEQRGIDPEPEAPATNVTRLV
ncbi:N-acetylneuraminate synthase family protein [Acidocella sp. KAb 2-4]|uniref:N-acetylneuraminate synthase family protein n=1 Tax=Acidocella sp. KAb 2-4 TaxID=2885158 RepID=UPI001D07BDF7|nr:N-acetylneuraminate synthase family protein [Acidocella sp. KAb 2-4]MCB5943650.1 N-acetylneuraminate synthase family protein [Acidocella sp. KAb 2-4]